MIMNSLVNFQGEWVSANSWTRLTSREIWDFIDGVYLKFEMSYEELLELLELSSEEYLALRKSNRPPPRSCVDKIARAFNATIDDWNKGK